MRNTSFEKGQEIRETLKKMKIQNLKLRDRG